MIRAMLFDLDGTLVLSEHLKARSYAIAIRELGRVGTTDEDVLEVYKEQVGQTRDTMSRFLMEKFDLEALCRPLIPRYGVQDPWQVLTAMRMAHYEGMVSDPKLLQEYQRPFSIGLLRIAHKEGCRTALATSSQTDEARRVLDTLQLLDQFEEVIGADQVERHKPDPDIYLLAARRLDTPPQECLVIEDSPTGVNAGLAAGMNVVAVSNDMTETGLHNFSGLDHRWIVHQPENLLGVVEELFAEHNRAVHHDEEG
ncbi:MAG: HAD family hydrolase [Dehalococcoidia bacterium]